MSRPAAAWPPGLLLTVLLCAFVGTTSVARAERVSEQVVIGLSTDVVDLDAGQSWVDVTVAVDDALLAEVRSADLVWRPEGVVQSRTQSIDFPINVLETTYRMEFPAGSAPGRWRLIVLWLKDEHGITRELYPGTVIEVRNSDPDLTPPAGVGVSLSPSAVDLSTGDRSVDVVVDAVDDRDLYKAWVYLRHGGSTQRKTVELQGPVFQGTTTFVSGPAGDAAGTWFVDDVTIFDGATNRVFGANVGDSTALQVQVTNPGSDTTLPDLDAISFSASVVDVTAGRGTLDVSVAASDAGTGIASISGRVQADSTGQRRRFGIDPATGSTTLVFDDQDSTGPWRLTSLTLVDAAGNQRDLRPDAAAPADALPALTFDVGPLRPEEADARIDVTGPRWVIAGSTVDLDVGLFASGPGTAGDTLVTLSADLPVSWEQPPAGFPTSCSIDAAQIACSTGSMHTLFHRSFPLSVRFDVPGSALLSAVLSSSTEDPIQTNNRRHLRVQVLDPDGDVDCDGFSNAVEAAQHTNPLVANGGTGCAGWLPEDVQVLLGTDLVDVSDGPASLPLQLVLAAQRTEVVRVVAHVGGPGGEFTAELTPQHTQAEILFDDRVRGGRWRLWRLEVFDDTGHVRTLAPGTPFTLVSPAPRDRDGPELLGLTLSPASIDVTNGPVQVTLDVDAADASGVARAEVYLYNFAANRQRVLMLDDPAAGGTFIFSSADPGGPWEVRSVALADPVGNFSFTDYPRGQGAELSVQNDAPPPQPPVLHGVSLASALLDASIGPARLGVSVQATAGTFPLARAEVKLCHRQTNDCRTAGVPLPGGSAEILFDTWEDAGPWIAFSLILVDSVGTRTYFPVDLERSLHQDPEPSVATRFELVHSRSADLADLSGISASAPAWVFAGEELALRYQHWNAGPATALDVTLDLAASRPVGWGRHFVSPHVSGFPDCVGDALAQSCALVDTANPGSGVYFFRLTAAEAGPLILDLELDSSTPDSRPGDTSAQVVVQVLDPAADHDGDGVSNQDEAAAGTDPLVAEACDPLVCRSSILLKIIPLLERR